MTPLIMQTDPDQGTLIKLPKGWRLGVEFEPRIDCLVIGDDPSTSLEFNLPQPDQSKVGFKMVDLDGEHCIELAYWLEVSIETKDELLSRLLDPDIAKSFRIVLVDATDPQVFFDPAGYTEIITADVAVFGSGHV